MFVIANFILLEEPLLYYLTYSLEVKGVHTFPQGYLFESEANSVYFDSTEQRFNHYTTTTPPKFKRICFKKKISKDPHLVLVYCLFWFYDNFVGNLTPKPFLCKFSVLFQTIQFSMSRQFVKDISISNYSVESNGFNSDYSV